MSLARVGSDKHVNMKPRKTKHKRLAFYAKINSKPNRLIVAIQAKITFCGGRNKSRLTTVLRILGVVGLCTFFFQKVYVSTILFL